MEHQLFKVTQNVLIKNNEGLILILQHKTGKWLLPGGRINIGENSTDGLRREIKEEIGIENIEIKKVVDINSWIEGDIGSYVVLFVVAIPQDSKIVISEEHIGYTWVGLENLDQYEFWHNDIVSRIEKYLIKQ